MTPDWYRGQAALLRDRAEELRLVVARLAEAPLFSLHHHAGEETWQCPAAVQFMQELLAHQGTLRELIDELRVNASGMSSDAEDCDRHAAYLEALVS